MVSPLLCALMAPLLSFLKVSRLAETARVVTNVLNFDNSSSSSDHGATLALNSLRALVESTCHSNNRGLTCHNNNALVKSTCHNNNRGRTCHNNNGLEAPDQGNGY